MRGSIRIGRIFGIPLTVNLSWLLILGLVVTTLATEAFPETFQGRPAWAQWALAALTALIFFGSMVLHELGHSVVARRIGVPVRSITLFALGAVAQTTRESRRASHEFWMAIAGPAVSLGLALLFFLIWLASGHDTGTVAGVSEWLFVMNLSVGIFNMIPAFPMDGGRVLRSVLWGVSGSHRRATRWASLVGRGIAFTAIGVGILVALRFPGVFEEMHPFNAVQFILLGLFINWAATQSDVHSGVLDILSRVRAGDAMLRDIPAALAQTTAAEALAGPSMGYGAAREWLLVSDGQRILGVAPRQALMAVPEEAAHSVPVGNLMIPAHRLRAVGPDETLSEVLQRMDAEEAPVFVVIDGGEVVGLLHRPMVMARGVPAPRRQAAADRPRRG